LSDGTDTELTQEQAEDAIAQGLTLRRPYAEFAHPVVRTHPVTKRKALYVNPLFTRRIPELSVAESGKSAWMCQPGWCEPVKLTVELS